MSGYITFHPLDATVWPLVILALVVVTVGKIAELARARPLSFHVVLMAFAHSIPMVLVGVGLFQVSEATATLPIKLAAGAVVVMASLCLAMALRRLVRNDDAAERASLRVGPPEGVVGIQKISSDPA